MKVITFTGQKQNGKTTASKYLVEKLNSRYKIPVLWNKVGFADAVKKIYMDTFVVSLEFIEHWKCKDEAPPGFLMSVREGLRFIGDGFRKIQPNIWIDIVFRKDIPKIIDDGRYFNEGVATRSNGGLNVLIWRKDFENDDKSLSESQMKPTVDWFVKSGLEGDMRDKVLPEKIGDAYPGLFDFFIRNEGTKEDLYKKINTIIPLIENFYNV